MDSTDPERVVRLAVAEALARVADEDSLGLGEGDAVQRLGSALREVLHRALDDRVPLTTPDFVDLCRELRLDRDAFDLLGHYLMTALLAQHVGPDALIRVGVLLGTVGRYLPSARPTHRNAGPAPRRRDVRADNSVVGRYHRAKLPEHLPNPPSWTCTGCGREWPCATKQSQLLAEFGGARAALAVYLGSCLVAAAQDLPTLPLPRVRLRFLGWLPRARI
ncbi:hypothetical protein O7614_15185 [Micromonospora sp. WMMD961]|uniref:hypothetical protein n=1 Tax=Micromonospora sp. WMMD961 TaxID=3016100 RepID=UPI002417532B|nr:hypothetical protein [Micromonospora sp. WMMD961]MDG4780989.1 hypothetical protein [Micromonospora sp. WMMD961]